MLAIKKSLSGLPSFVFYSRYVLYLFTFCILEVLKQLTNSISKSSKFSVGLWKRELIKYDFFSWAYLLASLVYWQRREWLLLAFLGRWWFDGALVWLRLFCLDQRNQPRISTPEFPCNNGATKDGFCLGPPHPESIKRFNEIKVELIKAEENERLRSRGMSSSYGWYYSYHLWHHKKR